MSGGSPCQLGEATSKTRVADFGVLVDFGVKFLKIVKFFKILKIFAFFRLKSQNIPKIENGRITVVSASWQGLPPLIFRAG